MDLTTTLRVASVYLLIEFVGCGPCFATVVPRCPDTDTPRKNSNNKVTWNIVASHLCGETSGCTRTGIFSIKVTGFAGCLTFWKWIRDGVWHLSFEQKMPKNQSQKKLTAERMPCANMFLTLITHQIPKRSLRCVSSKDLPKKEAEPNVQTEKLFNVIQLSQCRQPSARFSFCWAQKRPGSHPKRTVLAWGDEKTDLMSPEIKYIDLKTPPCNAWIRFFLTTQSWKSVFDPCHYAYHHHGKNNKNMWRNPLVPPN